MRHALFRVGFAVLGLFVVVSVAACGDGGAPVVSSPSESAPVSGAPPVESSAPPVSEEVPETTEGAIARYEVFLHAVGEEDIDTVCEIAGPAAKQAEEDGFGPCESTFAIMFDMISAEQSEALRTATVDPSKVDAKTDGTVDIPAAAIEADVTFTEDELGTVTLDYRKGNWFIVD